MGFSQIYFSKWTKSDINKEAVSDLAWFLSHMMLVSFESTFEDFG